MKVINAKAASKKWNLSSHLRSYSAMYRYQDSLPRLPVPSLDETADRYLKSLKPLLNEEEFEKTKSVVTDFIKPGGIGRKLQLQLEERASVSGIGNWLADWWNESAYMGYRAPVVPYVSYFYSYRDEKYMSDQLTRASRIISAALKFRDSVASGSLEPEFLRKDPICMSSYQYMFNCCRIPNNLLDTTSLFEPANNNHFIVAINGKFYKVSHHIDGRVLSTDEIKHQLEIIVQTANRNKGYGIGLLTSQNRDVWSRVRNELIAISKDNQVSLTAIESSSFIVCLDDSSPVTLNERARQFWHGNGINRWMDKPLNFIINKNATAGFLGEHSMMDGTPTLRLNDSICQELFEKSAVNCRDVVSRLPEPLELQFRVNAVIEKALIAANESFTKEIEMHELEVLFYQKYGRNAIKSLKCSPDAFTQLIIQLAYFRRYGVCRPTYESAATRKFLLGRTETCRSVTEDSVAFCKAMDDPNITNTEKAVLARAAMNTHAKNMVDACNGQAVDRHLFGLKNCLGEHDVEPELFKDPSYSYSSSWFLSTSQLSSEYLNGYGWSQVIDDGFGIAYMVNENALHFNVVSKKHGSSKMCHFIREAADDLGELISLESQLKSKL